LFWPSLAPRFEKPFLAFTEVLEKIRREVTRKVLDFFEETADYPPSPWSMELPPSRKAPAGQDGGQAADGTDEYPLGEESAVRKMVEAIDLNRPGGSVNRPYL
jgi:hypothetical protein